jgi:hypothetical protein
MNLGTAQAGHVVLADRWGRRFYAIVSSKGQGEPKSSRSIGVSPTTM